MKFESIYGFKKGFEGDGTVCEPAVPCSENPNVCAENAKCLPIERRHVQRPSRRRLDNQVLPEHACKCKTGFHGDGFVCEGMTFGSF